MQQVVHAIDEGLLLLDHGIGDLLEGQQHHVAVLAQERIDKLEELSLDLLSELGPDELVVPAENLKEDDVVELVEHEEAQQVLMLGDVAQQADDEFEEAAHLEVACVAADLQIHDQNFHQMYDLCQALEVFEGRAGVLHVPIDKV